MSRRLLILVTDLEIGGTPTVVRELAIRLHGRGHSVAVACLGRRGPVAEQIAEAGVEVTALGALGRWDFRVFSRLLTLLRTREFDSVLSFLIHANALAAVACSITGTRLFQSIQTTQAWPRWHWALQRLIAPLARRILVPSQSVADVARQRSGIAGEQIAVIPNGVDMAQFCFSEAAASVPCHVGFLGRLDSVKRIGDLIDAAVILKSEIHVDIFGDGPERAKLERQIIRLGLSDRVILHGAAARPQDALECMSILVLPSEAEGFGLVLIEAMAAGIPVVATNAPGIRDVVVHDRTGLLVPIADPPAIARAIRRLVDDESLRYRLIAAARRDVEMRFSWPAIISRYEQILFSEP